MTFNEILKNIEKQQFSPIYFLYGDETFFIDKLTHAIDVHALAASERDFNRELFYGTDANAGKILNAVKGFPSFADRKLVILKEAQSFKEKEWEKILSYFDKPSPTTVFVIAYREGKLKGSAKKALDKCAKKNVAFESKKMYEWDVVKWVRELIKTKGFDADGNIADEIVGFLGLNLGAIENELDKIFIVLNATGQKKLTKEIVYDMMNIDREFNVFELIKALSWKDAAKAHLIIHKLSSNLKANPAVGTVNALFNFFLDPLSRVYAHNVTSVDAIMSQGIARGKKAAEDLSAARQKYPLQKVYHNIGYILEADLMLKGMIPTQMGEEHILKTLVFKILN